MNKKGFTLIELLAVIVILGILMLIAISSVTKYINNSKKEVYLKTINNMVDVVRNGLISEDGKYFMGDMTQKAFSLLQVELEKGSNKSPYGQLVHNNSYVLVTKTSDGYEYKVQVEADTGYCIELIDINKLDKTKIIRCDVANMEVGPLYAAYQIGDQVNFAGSNWYVIKDSTSVEDYVTLMKEKVLTNSELGDNGVKYNCTSANVLHGHYNCKTEGEEKSFDTMSFYWSDTCHEKSIYGYTDLVQDGCTNLYSVSNIKPFLEEEYVVTLGSDNLKEIDGYKIRLITRNELRTNLGWTNLDKKATDSSNNVPTWVYSDIGDVNNGNVKGFWTMSQFLGSTESGVLCSNGNSSWLNCNVYGFSRGVRPVINLLKSSIN